MNFWNTIFAICLLFVAAFSSDAKRWISPDIVIPLRKTLQLKTKTFESSKQLLEEIQKIKQHSFDVSDSTTQQITSQFAKTLLKKLPDSNFKTKMQLQSKAHEKRRWDNGSQKLFEKVLQRYFNLIDKGDDRQEMILSVAKELGQMNSDGSNTETNAFKAKYVKELKTSFAAESQQSLLPDTNIRSENLKWIQKTFNENQASIQVYHMCNHFFGVPKRKSLMTKEKNFQGAEASFDMSGSLNTYCDHGEVFEPLEHLKSWANDIVKEDDELSIAQRIYLIWKTSGYTTIDHQDVHQKQHLVSYHQMKGKAIFHILPPICGLYVAHLYANQDLEELKKTLTFFDKHKIGSYTHLKQGEIIFLPPDKTHFVQVPYSSEERVDYVRAFEVLFDYHKMEERQMLLESESRNSDLESNPKDSDDCESMSTHSNADSNMDERCVEKQRLRMPAKERTFGETRVCVHTTSAGRVIGKLYVQEKHICSFHSMKAAEDAVEILRPIRKRLSRNEALNLIDKILDEEVQHRLTESPDLYRQSYAGRRKPSLKLRTHGILIEMIFEAEKNLINARGEILKYIVKNTDLDASSGGKKTKFDHNHVKELRNITRKHKLVDKNEELETSSALHIREFKGSYQVLKGNTSFGCFKEKNHAQGVRNKLEMDVVQAWPNHVDFAKLVKTDEYEEFRKMEALRCYHKKLESLKNPKNDSHVTKGRDMDSYIVKMRVPPGKTSNYGAFQTREKAKKVAMRVLELYTKSLEERIRGRNFAQEPIQAEKIKEILEAEGFHENKRKREEESD